MFHGFKLTPYRLMRLPLHFDYAQIHKSCFQLFSKYITSFNMLFSVFRIAIVCLGHRYTTPRTRR